MTNSRLDNLFMELQHLQNIEAFTVNSHCFSPLCTGMAAHSAGAAQDPSQSTGERGELVHTLSKETPGSPEASELGSPRCLPNFDLLNMVVSYKRMALFLEPVADAVELSRFLLGCVYACCLLEH